MNNNHQDWKGTPAIEELTGVLRTAVAEMRNEPMSDAALRRVLERVRSIELLGAPPIHFSEFNRARDVDEHATVTAPATLAAPSRRSIWGRVVPWCPRHLAWSGIGVAACAAVLVLAFLVSGPIKSQSVFAESIRALEQAPAIHMLESSTDTKRPGELLTAETWVVRGTGYSHTLKKNGKLVWHGIDDLNSKSIWDAEANEVRIEPSQFKIEIEVRNNPNAWYQLAKNFEDTLSNCEQRAKQSGVPIKTEDVREGSVQFRRVSIGEVRFGDDELGEMMSLIVDIEKRSGRIVRSVSTLRSYGNSQLLPDGRRVQIWWANENRISETKIEYPDQDAVDKALFVFTAPEGARVVQDEVPLRVRQDELKMKGLHDLIRQYRSEHDDRFPKDWLRELMPYADHNKFDFVSMEAGAKSIAEPNFTSWRLMHAGEKSSDLPEPDQTVIAEYRHTWGYLVRLFASGRTDVKKL
jgi:hypothetical protein